MNAGSEVQREVATLHALAAVINVLTGASMDAPPEEEV